MQSMKLVIALASSLYCLNDVQSLPMNPSGIQYGVIMDAGSSSTKIRIYAWQVVQDGVPDFNEVFYSKEKPGISSFEHDVDGIAAYMKTMLDDVKKELPQEVWKTTPVFFMATAGLRLLDETVTHSIMGTVNAVMADPAVNPFVYQDGFAHILAGEEEALYAWITINYLNGFFSGTHPVTDSYGLIEIGGGSTQIAFIPDDPIYAGKMPLTVAGKEYDIYTHSHLSYGADLMADRIAAHIIRENPYANVIENPCMLKGDKGSSSLDGKMVGVVGGGNVSQCEDLLTHYLSSADTIMCSPRPCSIGQVYQPSIRDRKFFTFGLVHIIAKHFNAIDNNGALSLKEMQANARKYCNTSLDEAVDTYKVSAQWASRNCQDGLYIPLLFSALGFSMDNPNIVAGKDLNGASIAWSLGGIVFEEERNAYFNEHD